MTDLRAYHREATDVARAVVDAVRLRAGAAFAPAVAAGERHSDLDRLLAALGRDPHGTAPAEP